MNSWSFSGNLGKDAVQRFTTGGDSVVSFSVGVKSGFGDKATTTWANCQMWGKRGESVLPYLNKGQLVGVSGEATLREYDRKEGGKGYSLDVRVNDVTLLGKKDDAPARQAPASSKTEPSNFEDFESDIPF